MQETRISYETLEKSMEAVRAYASEVSDSLGYDEASFEQVVTRDLYYRLLNSRILNDLEITSSDLTTVQYEVLEKIFLNSSHFQMAKKIDLSIGLLEKVTHSPYARAFRSYLSAIRLQLFNKNNYQSSAGDLAIHVIHPKFVRFLTPILQKTSEPFYFLVSFPCKDLIEAIEKEGFSYIYCAPFLKNRWVLTNKTLCHWNHLVFLYELLKNSIRELRPSRVLVVEGNAPQDEVARLAAKSLGVSSICLQQGWSPYSHPGFEKMKFDKFLSWGEGFSRLLQEKNPEQKFIATGNHMLLSQERVRKKPRSSLSLSFFLQGPTHIIGSYGWNQMLELISHLCHQHPTECFMVREHPGFPLTRNELDRFKKLKNLKVIFSQDMSLADQLSGSWMSVSIYSTVLFESIASLVPAYAANFSSLPRLEPDFEAYRAGIVETNMDQMLRDFSDFIKNPETLDSFLPGMKAFKKDFFVNESNEAISRTVREIFC